jgi:hypothetical protein
MQVRIASNNQVILANSGSIVVPGGLTGTQQITIDGMPQPSGVIGNAVYGLPLPAVQWNGPQYTHRTLEGSVETGAVGSPSPRQIGSLLNRTLPWGGSYAGSQEQPNPQLTGIQPPAGTTSTASWRWRIFF